MHPSPLPPQRFSLLLVCAVAYHALLLEEQLVLLATRESKPLDSRRNEEGSGSGMSRQKKVEATPKQDLPKPLTNFMLECSSCSFSLKHWRCSEFHFVFSSTFPVPTTTNLIFLFRLQRTHCSSHPKSAQLCLQLGML